MRYYGFSNTDKLHKTKGTLGKNKRISACGMSLLDRTYCEQELSPLRKWDLCQRCFKISKSKPLSQLVDKSFSEWCGRIGIKL